MQSAIDSNVQVLEVQSAECGREACCFCGRFLLYSGPKLMGWIHCKRCNFAHFSATVMQSQILPMGGGRRIPLFLVTFSRLGGARPLQPLYTTIWYWFSSTRMQHDLCKMQRDLCSYPIREFRRHKGSQIHESSVAMSGWRRRTIFRRRSFDCFQQQHHDFQAKDVAPTESLGLTVLAYPANLDTFSRCHSRQVTRLRPKSVEPSQ